MTPTFRYIPVLGNLAKCDLRVVQVDALSTKHDNTNSDGGALYASVVGGSGIAVNLYADPLRTRLVLSGAAGDVGQYATLTAQSGSGLSGRAYVASYAQDDSDIVVLASFATDVDVMFSQASCQGLAGPAYDTTYGLAALHAQAMREILASALPAAVPHLFGKEGLAPYVPGQVGPAIPDLRKMANVGQLRQAAGALAKAITAEQQEHLADMAAIAVAARARYVAIMQAVAAANVEEAEEAKQETSNISVGLGSWSRG